ncbi:hypothetical protein TcasGA2_TC004089 [Tribolium castaneum]|uniref:DUF8207 domain-containing protein n=1 Tax=Tribolium castaneum TaxID=7070 RepID=D7GY88_TRICA|nr:hypothetical protein TcasGA2_TC004089 [Tribolium castaneum]
MDEDHLKKEDNHVDSKYDDGDDDDDDDDDDDKDKIKKEDKGDNSNDSDTDNIEKDDIIQQTLKLLKTNKHDKIYGPKINPINDSMKLGRKVLKIKNNGFLQIGNDMFQGTDGLYELVFHKRPNEKKISINDMNNYLRIIKLTNLHRIDPENKFSRIKGSKNYKYLKYIKPLVKKNPTKLQTISKQTGKGLMSPTLSKRNFKLNRIRNCIYNEKPVEVKYWNDINELVTRLAYLHGELQAGNDNNINEIYEIEDELREEGVIY